VPYAGPNADGISCGVTRTVAGYECFILKSIHKGDVDGEFTGEDILSKRELLGWWARCK
jgi:hypothetical protein